MRPLTLAVSLVALAASLAAAPSSLAAPPGGGKPRPAGGGSAAPRAPHHLSANEYLPTSALRPGMKGYGLTIFQGTKIERFDVTVLGVLKKVNNGRDLIFVRLGGPNMKRYTDVIAGMSGSPVYVNGRIVGAVAYGAQFTREPLGYLTPIEDMLDAWDPHLPQSAEESLPDLPGRPPAPPGGLKVRDSRLPHPLRPLMTPVSLSGVPRSRFAQWAAALEPLGLRVKMSPVGAASAAATGAGLQGSALAPGGAVAMSLATGDIDVSGIGTLTYRRDKRIVAFGHPFMGIGPINAPMYTARIHDVQPSFAESEKIGSAVSLVGAFTQDRPFSIGGTIGATPKMVPITVRVDDKAFRRQRTFQAKLVRHPMLTPVLAPLAAGSAIAEMHGQPGDAMATVKLTVEADEVGTVTRTNRFFDPATIDMPATSELSQLMRTLATNPFYPVGVRRITMDVTIEPGRRTAQVERIFLKQTQFEPGDTVQVGVVLKPYKAERFVRNVSLRIPPGTPNGTLLLMVQGGGGMAGGITIGPGGTLVLSGGANPNAASVRQIVRDFAERERNDQIVARVMLPSAAVSVRGEKLSGLPPHLDAVMRAGRSSGLRLEREEVKSTLDTQYVLSGLQYLPIRVAKKGMPQGGGSGGTLVSPTTLPGSNPTIPAAPPGGAPGAPPLGIDPDDEEIIRAGLAGLLPESLGAVLFSAPPAGEGEEEEEEPATGGAAKAAGADDKPASAGGDAPAATPEAKSVVRAPGIFRQASAADFRAGTLEGLTLTSEGELRLAPRLAKVTESDDPYFWAIVPDGAGGVFVGSGDSGRVYRVGPDGRRAVFAETGEFEVHALARAADGTLYAGTSPNGRVLRVSPDGKVTPLLDTPEQYVLALATGKDGTLYVGTGGSRARVYAVRPDAAAPIKAAPAPVYASSEGSVTALAAGPDGTVYAGTAPGGLVVRVAGPGAAAGKPEILFDAAEASVSGLAVAPDGSICAATFGSPSGALYRIEPDGSAARPLLAEKPPTATTYYGMATSPDGTVYSASGSTVIAVGPDQTVRSFEAPSDIQILALARDERGRLWAATGNVGGVYALGSSVRSGTKGSEGVFTSSVLDARANATWGTLRFSAAVPEGSRVAVRTRSGSVAEPDATWSDWSPAITTPTGAKVASPPGRYLQYRVTLTPGDGGAETGSPALRVVEAFYRTPNQAPTVAITAPRGGEVWRGTKTLRWTGTDPDRDALSYEVQVSGDGGKTWKPVEGAKPKPAPSEAKKAPAPGSPEADRADNEKKMIESLEAELARHPEMSAEMKVRILADAPASIRAVLEGPSPTGAAGPTGTTRETSIALDTARYPDGVYRVRVVATDRAANADDPKTGEKTSAEFRIVNKPPTLVPGNGGPTTASDRTVRVEGTALHDLVAIRAVQWRLDGGEWMAASASDGLFDSGSEAFRVVTAALAPGTHKLEIQAIDEAGGNATETVTVTVK